MVSFKWIFLHNFKCEVTVKKETYGLSLKLLGIDKESEMLEVPEWQSITIGWSDLGPHQLTSEYDFTVSEN